MSSAAAWAMLVGPAAPFATGLLVKASWPAWGKVLVTIAAVVGAATVSFRYIVDRVPGLKDWLYGVWVKDRL
jgi:hypothetical protein